MPDILDLLITERDKLTRAIDALQGTRRRGRPPKVAASIAASPAPKRRGMSRAGRLAQSRRMRAYWAARRKRQVKKPGSAAAAAPWRRPSMSAAARKAASERMKRYWAARRKAKKTATVNKAQATRAAKTGAEPKAAEQVKPVSKNKK